ncbi:MAG TPA: hypothetical protein VMM84_15390 [Pyrinomonadaceae bacterium]|nr:hypothetical protein [Pyrinomonadaceae bacterium]
MSDSELWRFLPFGYLLTILVETPILIALLSNRHPFRRRIVAGIWLTACTYPVVVLVLPVLLAGFSRTVYLVIAETFAPVAECLLFWLAFRSADVELPQWLRDFGAIVAANLASFITGEILHAYSWLGVLNSRLVL